MVGMKFLVAEIDLGDTFTATSLDPISLFAGDAEDIIYELVLCVHATPHSLPERSNALRLKRAVRRRL